MGTMTLDSPSPKRKRSLSIQTSAPTVSPLKTINSISSRLERLAALAWDAEEDNRLDDHTRASIQSQLHAIEAQLEGRTRGNEQTSSDVDVDLSNSASPAASSASSMLEPTVSYSTPAMEPQAAPAPDLQPVIEHLNTTLLSMRARLSESKHLHTLTMSKLSSIAQANVDLTSHLASTRNTNTSLSHANAALRMRIDDLEATTTQQAVAVSAMTGAVAGLESYVASSSLPSTPRNGFVRLSGQDEAQNHTPNSGARRQTTVRGSGRFRGKYPIANSPPHLSGREGADVNMNLDGGTDVPRQTQTQAQAQTELQEGILAWVRGFRDVEAGWREMDVHRTPTRFGNGHVTEIQDSPQTPAAREESAPTGSEEEEDSVLLQGNKNGGSDVFHREPEEFGDFQTVTGNGDG